MKTIPFFTGDIMINVHTANKPENIKVMTLEEFANGEAISLHENNGELLAQKSSNGDFIEGPEIV